MPIDLERYRALYGGESLEVLCWREEDDLAEARLRAAARVVCELCDELETARAMLVDAVTEVRRWRDVGLDVREGATHHSCRHAGKGFPLHCCEWGGVVDQLDGLLGGRSPAKSHETHANRTVRP